MSEAPEIFRCKYCGAQIQWLKRDSMGGTCIPVDAKLVKVMLWDSVGKRWFRRDGHVMHFQTCTAPRKAK